MQWLVSVVAVVCLVAARPARPDDVGGRGESRQLLSAASSAAALLAPRQGDPRPGLRLSPYHAPAAPAVLRPPSARTRCAACLVADVAEPVPPVPVSRGPPRG